MTIMYVVMSVLAMATCSSLQALTKTDAISFKTKSVVKSELSYEHVKQGLKIHDVSVYEPHMGELRIYRGVSFKDVLNKIYGKEWSKYEEILFTCKDGYQPSVPLAKVKNHDAYLVFARQSGSFIIDNKLQNKVNVDLGPYYLVWENIKNQAIRADGVGDWPYQIVGIDLIMFADKFKKLAPAKNSSQKVIKGFLAFRNHCMRCHSINGEGGTLGIELNYPASVTEYWKEDWLKKWIIDPSQIRHKTTMPGLKEVATNAAQLSDDIVTYLKSMAKHKQKP